MSRAASGAVNCIRVGAARAGTLSRAGDRDAPDTLECHRSVSFNRIAIGVRFCRLSKIDCVGMSPALAASVTGADSVVIGIDAARAGTLSRAGERGPMGTRLNEAAYLARCLLISQ